MADTSGPQLCKYPSLVQRVPRLHRKPAAGHPNTPTCPVAGHAPAAEQLQVHAASRSHLHLALLQRHGSQVRSHQGATAGRVNRGRRAAQAPGVCDAARCHGEVGPCGKVGADGDVLVQGDACVLELGDADIHASRPGAAEVAVGDSGWLQSRGRGESTAYSDRCGLQGRTSRQLLWCVCSSDHVHCLNGIQPCICALMQRLQRQQNCNVSCKEPLILNSPTIYRQQGPLPALLLQHLT